MGILPLDFLLRNVGRSPALDVHVRIVQFYGHLEHKNQLAKEEQESCDAVDTEYPPTPLVVDNTDLMRTNFPDDVLNYNSRALTIIPAQLSKLEDRGEKGFPLWFYGCVRYTSAAKERHQTSFAYMVSHIVDAAIPGGKAMEVMFKLREDIPAERILLQARPMASGVTN